ncbi:hypothetical protein NUKP18_03530 [Klebsiella variicola]|nr:hypothetical protein NUKP18_03530 [Klebsiella variicola]
MMEVFSENMLRAKTHTAMMLCSTFPLRVPAQGDFFIKQGYHPTSLAYRKIFVNRLNPYADHVGPCCYWRQRYRPCGLDRLIYHIEINVAH